MNENLKNSLEERFEFRNIRPEEAQQTVEIEQICFPPHEACSEEHMKERVAAAPDLFLVAVDKSTGKIAGFLNGLSTKERVFRDEFFTDVSLHDPNGEFVMLLGLDVLPEYRRQGLATEIVARYVRREKEKGRRKLILTCLNMKVEMYRKMGFADLGIANSSWGGEEWHEMTYEIASEESSDYITTYGGTHFYPTNPKPEDIHITDIAHALSLICRGNGHVKTFFSVGQHCINCALEAEARGAGGRLILACLLHDASECYMSDVPRPFKKTMVEYQKQEEYLLQMIYQHFLGSALTEDEQKFLKQIDDDLLYYDLKELLNEPPEGEAPVLHIDLNYEVQPFETVEKNYLQLYERYQKQNA